jgi:hypothetical protein
MRPRPHNNVLYRCMPVPDGVWLQKRATRAPAQDNVNA